MSSTQRERETKDYDTLTDTSRQFTSAEKIQLFMELFRGRDDVFPKQWINTRKGTIG